LPYIGPVLICLLLAKLFRPKQINDFWLLHTVGLMEVILACVLASEPLFGLLLFAYLICAVWSLSLFHAYRERLRSGEEVKAAATARPHGLARAALWSTLLALIALPIFLLTPKLGESAWSPFLLNRVGPAEVGYSDAMDLNRTGRLRPSDEVAFEVEARDAGDGPKTDLDREQRWRGAVLDHYERGRWSNLRGLQTTGPVESIHYPRMLFPRPQRGEYTLAFTVPGERGDRPIGLFLADPISLPDAERTAGAVNRLAPVASRHPEGRRGWSFDAADQTLIPALMQRGPYRYVQLVTPAKDPNLSPPIGDSPQLPTHYLQQPIPGLRRAARELIERFREEGKLTADEVTIAGEQIRVPPEHWEKVAGLFTDYLATSGEFGYTLQLTRKDLTLDPNEDFLRNLRRGHCERFASALALLARSCNIPARVVVGFRGAAAGEVDGSYVVRQNDAHGWVEVPVVRPGPEGVRRWHWRTFDPTPSEDPTATEAAISLDGWVGWQQLGNLLWRNFVVDYNAEKRNEAAGYVTHWWFTLSDMERAAERLHAARAVWLATGLVLALALVMVGLRWRRGHGTAPAPGAATFGFPAYVRLLALLKQRLELAPKPSQTPREFAAQAGAVLRARPAAASLAEVPRRVVELLYRAHFGKQPMTPEEAEELERRLHEVEAGLGRPNHHLAQ
jgi:hypothetical protein